MKRVLDKLTEYQVNLISKKAPTKWAEFDFMLINFRHWPVNALGNGGVGVNWSRWKGQSQVN